MDMRVRFIGAVLLACALLCELAPAFASEFASTFKLDVVDKTVPDDDGDVIDGKGNASGI
jgi:hypothetical protein